MLRFSHKISASDQIIDNDRQTKRSRLHGDEIRREMNNYIRPCPMCIAIKRKDESKAVELCNECDSGGAIDREMARFADSAKTFMELNWHEGQHQCSRGLPSLGDRSPDTTYDASRNMKDNLNDE